MNQPTLSVLVGLGTFALFAAVVRLLPRRWTTPAQPVPPPACLHQGEPHLCLICRNGAPR